MRKKLLKSLVIAGVMMIFHMSAMAANGDVAIDETNFPDEVFSAYVSANFDTDGDGGLSQSEIESAKTISIYNDESLTSLQGIEYLTELTVLECGITGITELDVSNNTQLTYLSCMYTGVAELDVSENINLLQLDCYACTNLKELDVTNNTALTALNFGFTEITEIDLSNNIELFELVCENTELAELNLIKNVKLGSVIIDVLGDVYLPMNDTVYSITINDSTPILYYIEGNTEWYDAADEYTLELGTWIAVTEEDELYSMWDLEEDILITSDAAQALVDTSVDRENLVVETNDNAITFAEDALDVIANSDAKTLSVTMDDVEFVLDSATLQAIQEQIEGDVTIDATFVEIEEMSDEMLAVVGDKPVYQFLIYDAKGNVVSDFDGGSITVTIPYILGEDETADNLVIYYISDDAVLETIEIDSYDAENELLTFTVTHFSTYAVGYEEDADVTVPEGYILTRDYYNSVGGDFTSQIFGLTDGGVYTALEGVLWDLDGDTTLGRDTWGYFAIYDAETGEVLYDTYNDNFTAFDQTADGGCGGCFEFVADALEDGDYVLYFLAEDSEGATTERIIRFTIDSENGTEAIAIDWDGYTFEAEYYEGTLDELFAGGTTTGGTTTSGTTTSGTTTSGTTTSGTTTSGTTTSGTTDSPETGDTANIALYVMLAILACSGIAVVTKRRMA